MVEFESDELRPGKPRSKVVTFLIYDWPYLLMLALAILGVAYTSVSNTGIRTYWMALGPLFGIITVAVHWRDAKGVNEHWQLVRTQALHWAAVMFAMYLVLLSDVHRMLGADGSALAVLTVLALGTFTAGIHAEAWRITLVGLVLGLAVPALAWLQRSTLLVLLVVIVLVAFAILIFLHSPVRENAGRAPEEL
ncbi:MAG TPA: hypothetical protein VFG05_02400 [Methylocella sp.]|nr:hypothetical protein [Methylocella sp.]